MHEVELREQPEGAEQLVRARHDEVEGEGLPAARLLRLVRVRVRVRARARVRVRVGVRVREP